MSITPTLNTSKVLVFEQVTGGNDAGVGNFFLQLKRDTTAINIGDAASARTRSTSSPESDAGAMFTVGWNYLDSPATTSATTYKVQGATQAGTFYINRTKTDGDFSYYGRGACSITVMEILV